MLNIPTITHTAAILYNKRVKMDKSSKSMCVLGWGTAGQSFSPSFAEPTSTHKPTTMDGWYMGRAFFSLGSCFPANIPIAKGHLKVCQRF
jgi:hypothetical protein